MSAPQVVETRRHFQGRIVGVRVDQVRLGDGRTVAQEVVEHRPSMTVIAVDDEGRLVLVRQYRHPVRAELLETPAGSVDEGETAEEAVNRELAEETGLRARTIRKLGAFYLAPGWTDEFMHVYLATDLEEADAEADPDEEITVVRLPIEEWETLIARGEIRDSKSLAAWLLARPYVSLA
jgi:ADP-ribose pyrophosphatase